MMFSDADLLKYEGLIAKLRVVDLRAVLDYFKSPKLGLKQELVKRCISLLKSLPHQAELVRQVDDLSKRSYRPASYLIPNRPISMPTAGPANGITQGSCSGQTVHMIPGLPVCALSQARPLRGLRAVVLPFYDPILTLMNTVELPAATDLFSKTPMRQIMNFCIPREQVGGLCYNSTVKSLPRIEIQLRFFLLGGAWKEQEQPDQFPPNCQVKLDEQLVALPVIIPTNQPNMEAKRPPSPVDLTPYCQPPKEHKENPHKLCVEWTGDRRSWACAVYIVNRVNSSVLRERAAVDKHKQQTAEDTKQIVIHRLANGHDDGITMDQLKISLLCPLGKIRMKFPARCRDCTHLQCFDLDLFLQMNEKRPTWKCAVCSGNAPFDRLIIDGYFQNIVKDVGPNITEVLLQKDGGYQIAKEDVVDLCDEDDSHIENVAAPSHDMSGPGNPIYLNRQSDDMDVIVLSSDDDDDNVRTAYNGNAANKLPLRVPDESTRRSRSPFSDDSIIILNDAPPRIENPDSHVNPSSPVNLTPRTVVPGTTSGSSCDQIANARPTSSSSAAFLLHVQLLPSTSSTHIWNNPALSGVNTMLPESYTSYRPPNATIAQCSNYVVQQPPPMVADPTTAYSPRIPIPSVAAMPLAAMPSRTNASILRRWGLVGGQERSSTNGPEEAKSSKVPDVQ